MVKYTATLWVHIFIVIQMVTSSQALTCSNCRGVSDIPGCTNITQCSNGKSCLVRKYVDTIGHVAYDLGCIDTWFCNQISSVKRDGEMVLWNRCCGTSDCNKQYNGDGDKQNNGHGGTMTTTVAAASLFCASCRGPKTCSFSTSCGPHQECFSERTKDELGRPFYDSGCSDIKICQEKLKSNNATYCFQCCSSFFCNYENIC